MNEKVNPWSEVVALLRIGVYVEPAVFVWKLFIAWDTLIHQPEGTAVDRPQWYLVLGLIGLFLATCIAYLSCDSAKDSWDWSRQWELKRQQKLAAEIEKAERARYDAHLAVIRRITEEGARQIEDLFK